MEDVEEEGQGPEMYEKIYEILNIPAHVRGPLTREFEAQYDTGFYESREEVVLSLIRTGIEKKRGLIRKLDEPKKD